MAEKRRKRAWGIFRRYPTELNLIAFKRARSEARRIRRESQRSSWQHYLSTTQGHVTSKTIWRKVKSISGRYVDQQPLSILNKNGHLISDFNGIANELGAAFASVSSDDSNSTFLNIKQRQERQKINFRPFTGADYNVDLEMFELMAACASTNMNIIERQSSEKALPLWPAA